MHLAVNFLSASSLISAFGVGGVLAILFAETGLLIGFFLPGDTLLFTAGLLTVPGLVKGPALLPLPGLVAGAPLAAIAGAQAGHYLGAKAGPLLFSRPSSRFFRHEYLERAEHHFRRYGEGKAVLIARFIPIVRTFINPVAGALGMPPRTFFAWNVLGGVVWTEGVLLVAHFLGNTLGASFPIERYIIPIVIVIAVISVIPVLLEVRKVRRAGREGEKPPPASGRSSRGAHRMRGGGRAPVD